MNQLVSIVIPVYNVQNYIRCCLDSVIGQTYPFLDVLLIDDGSTDRSGEICNEFARRDNRIRVIHQQNAGAANAKNTGLDLAKGEYIAFLDSDDWVEPYWIQTMLHMATVNNADVVECGFWMEFAGVSESPETATILQTGTWKTEDYLRAYPAAWPCAIFWNKLFKATLISDVRFHRERRCVDDEFYTYKAITDANKVLRIDNKLYHYRQRRSSVTQTDQMRYQRTIDVIDILAERHSWMKEHYPNIALDYLRRDVSTLLYFAAEYPFNEKAISCFRRSATYYFFEAIHKFPGKVAMFYAVKALFYPKRSLLMKERKCCPEVNLERYYQ